MDDAKRSAETEARLTAQRRLLQWLLTKTLRGSAELDELMERLDEPYPPLDHQEDPGAVPTEAFGSSSAYAAEVRVLLEPAKAMFDRNG